MPPANPAGRPGATSGYVPVNGLDMYYEIHGDGSPLALFHGAMGTIDSCFADLLPALAATRQVVAVELQGHGHTADVDRPLSYQQMAADAAALLEALGIEMADLVGYSMGGGVAVELAMQHPDGLYPEMLAEPESAADDLTDSAWHRAYQRVAPDPGRWPVLVAKNGELDRTFAGWTDEDIQAMTTPMLLIIGDSDIVRPEHTVKMFRLLGGGVIGDLAGLPASQLAVLPGTSHVGLLDRVDWLQSMILEFLGTPAPRPL